ncbi:SAVED domain-containing protein [uncultured Polaribacter sp.]|uniref:SAVED domain-containing protein n=1 Tax=uncultured Polaribacter sp. TaxID=174711 RepID=UPI00259BA286|nr:SAVED domain-containing protein [uncultured Polaribacter sp.]
MSKKEDKIVKRVRKKLGEKPTIELWVKSGGRCQYVTCNKPLWKDSITLRKINKGYISHIIAASDNGPRGEKGKSEELELELSNLMLLCDECHNRIDKSQLSEHPKEVLIKMKQDHEKRIEMVTSIESDKKSHAIIYTANIGGFEPNISFMDSSLAMRESTYFPSSDLPIYLGLQRGLFTDDKNEYWQIQESQLFNSFRDKVKPLLEHGKPHFSIFGLAPQPLLIKLGVQLSEITNCEVYQNHRVPEQTWKWPIKQVQIDVQFKEPIDKTKKAVLIISMSDMVNRDRIHAVLGNEVSIWEITVDTPNRNILKSKQTLENFKNKVRDVFSDIRTIQGEQSDIHVFPVMPNACAIETGRVWMPKVDLPLIIYDQNKNRDGFYKTITIK